MASHIVGPLVAGLLDGLRTPVAGLLAGLRTPSAGLADELQALLSWLLSLAAGRCALRAPFAED